MDAVVTSWTACTRGHNAINMVARKMDELMRTTPVHVAKYMPAGDALRAADYVEYTGGAPEDAGPRVARLARARAAMQCISVPLAPFYAVRRDLCGACCRPLDVTAYANFVIEALKRVCYLLAEGGLRPPTPVEDGGGDGDDGDGDGDDGVDEDAGHDEHAEHDREGGGWGAEPPTEEDRARLEAWLTHAKTKIVQTCESARKVLGLRWFSFRCPFSEHCNVAHYCSIECRDVHMRWHAPECPFVHESIDGDGDTGADSASAHDDSEAAPHEKPLFTAMARDLMKRMHVRASVDEDTVDYMLADMLATKVFVHTAREVCVWAAEAVRNVTHAPVPVPWADLPAGHKAAVLRMCGVALPDDTGAGFSLRIDVDGIHPGGEASGEAGGVGGSAPHYDMYRDLVCALTVDGEDVPVDVLHDIVAGCNFGLPPGGVGVLDGVRRSMNARAERMCEYVRAHCGDTLTVPARTPIVDEAHWREVKALMRRVCAACTADTSVACAAEMRAVCWRTAQAPHVARARAAAPGAMRTVPLEDFFFTANYLCVGASSPAMYAPGMQRPSARVLSPLAGAVAHSCAPRTTVMIDGEVARIAYVHTTAAPAHAPLTVSRMAPAIAQYAYTERRRVIAGDQWGILCTCVRCALGPDVPQNTFPLPMARANAAVRAAYTAYIYDLQFGEWRALQMRQRAGGGGAPSPPKAEAAEGEFRAEPTPAFAAVMERRARALRAVWAADRPDAAEVREPWESDMSPMPETPEEAYNTTRVMRSLIAETAFARAVMRVIYADESASACASDVLKMGYVHIAHSKATAHGIPVTVHDSFSFLMGMLDKCAAAIEDAFNARTRELHAAALGGSAPQPPDVEGEGEPSPVEAYYAHIGYLAMAPLREDGECGVPPTPYVAARSEVAPLETQAADKIAMEMYPRVLLALALQQQKRDDEHSSPDVHEGAGAAAAAAAADDVEAPCIEFSREDFLGAALCVLRYAGRVDRTMCAVQPHVRDAFRILETAGYADEMMTYMLRAGLRPTTPCAGGGGGGGGGGGRGGFGGAPPPPE